MEELKAEIKSEIKNFIKIEKSREFCNKVKELAKQYNLSFFVVTEGASIISNYGCEAVKHARDCHIEWEKQHNLNPVEDWSNGKKDIKKCLK